MSPRITKELYSNKTTKKRLTDYLKRINSKLRKYQCPEWNQKRTLATRDPPLHPLLPQISSYSCPIHTTEKIANTGPLLSTRPLCFPLKSLYLSLNKATHELGLSQITWISLNNLLHKDTATEQESSTWIQLSRSLLHIISHTNGRETHSIHPSVS